jgi:HEPN domain-containing protein
MTLLDEWVKKAEDDYRMACALGLRRKPPLPDGVCYHCQQSAEKYLKAFLVMQGVAPPRTHSLRELLDLSEAIDARLAVLLPHIRILDPYSVRFRYPGRDSTVEESGEALAELRPLRRALRRALGYTR